MAWWSPANVMPPPSGSRCWHPEATQWMPPWRWGLRWPLPTRPRATSGGGGFMLVRMADGRSTFIDFRERAPLAASRNMYLDASGNATEDSMVGYRASGVPGTVRGLEYAAQKYRKKTLGGAGAPGRGTGRQGLSALLWAGARAAGERAGIEPLPGIESHLPEGRQILRGPARPWCNPNWAGRWSGSRAWAPMTSTRARPRASWPRTCRPTAG